MKVRFGDEVHEVEILQLTEGALEARIDGEVVEGDARRTADGAWSLILKGRSWEIYLVPGSTPGDWDVALEASMLSARLEDPRRYEAGTGNQVGADGWAEIRAPMPGKVVTLLVAEGDEVEAGQGLVVMEAMKMENEFTSPKAGKVAQIAVESGQSVEAGQLLAAVE